MSLTGRPPSIPGSKPEDLYFAYGSNMHLEQMAKRCPDSTIFAKGTLRNYKWQVNSRGGGNVVEGGPEDIVQGIVFKVSSSDIKVLRCCEGVEKQHFVEERLAIEVERILEPELRDRKTVDVFEILAQRDSGHGQSSPSDIMRQKSLKTRCKETGLYFITESLRKRYANLNDVFRYVKGHKEEKLSLSEDASAFPSSPERPGRHWDSSCNYLSPSDQDETREVEVTTPGKSSSRNFMCL